MTLIINIDVPGEKRGYFAARVVLGKCIEFLEDGESKLLTGFSVNINRDDGTPCGKMFFHSTDATDDC